MPFLLKNKNQGPWKQYIKFAIYVKRHIINEENDYRCDYDFHYCQVARASTDSIAEYMAYQTAVRRGRIDMNCHHSTGTIVDWSTC